MWRTWAEAMAGELHGSAGFYGRSRGPDADFRTAATVAPDLLAEAVVRLLGELPEHARREVVEVGAGGGQLLAALADRVPDEMRLIGVEQRARPAELPHRVHWQERRPESVTGLLLAFEWLDTVPVDVVVDGRVVEVASDGCERPGPMPTAQDEDWLRRWWPAGTRREVGHRRDAAWADAVARVTTGLAVAVDYGHATDGRPAHGSMTAYRCGRQVPPVPDPDTDVTAAVAWDAVHDAVEARGRASALLKQATALRRLGVSAALPGRSATTAAALRRASKARLLLDERGLGGFGWAATAVGIALPQALTAGGS